MASGAPDAFARGSSGCVVHPLRLAAYTNQQFANDWELWDEAEREWLEACAGAVSIALANDRLYAAAQRRADELKAVLDAVDVGISMVAADGRMLVRNQAAIEITGRQEDMGTLTEEAESYALRYALSGEPVPLEESPVARALRGERVHDVLLVMRDGTGAIE